MRVIVLDFSVCDGCWKPEGDFLVVAETRSMYKVERKRQDIFNKVKVVSQWVPKDGTYTRCEVVKGWPKI